jgi:hypothetical protein
MAKIRDLGISAIPVSMRPLEIGPGAAFDVPGQPEIAYFACEQCQCDNEGTAVANTSDCSPSGCYPAVSAPAGPGADRYRGGFTPDVVAQLRQQIQAHIGNELVQ